MSPSVASTPRQPPFSVGAVAFGDRYVRWSLAMIESLRRIGEFDGAVYIATDKPEAYEGLPGVHPHPCELPEDALQAKRYKPTILDWVPGGDVLYMDVDVIVGATMKPIVAMLSEVEKPLALFRQPGREGEPYHTGVMFLRRDSAGDACRRWKEAIDSGKHHRDQLAMGAALQPSDVQLLPDEHLLFTNAENCRAGEYRTFNHITMTGDQKSIRPSDLVHYLNGLGLETRPVLFSDRVRYVRRRWPKLIRRAIRQVLGIEKKKDRNKEKVPARLR